MMTLEPDNTADISVEMQYLGALLLDNDQYHRTSSLVAARHFLLELHQRIFKKIAELIRDDIVADPTTLKVQLASDPDMTGFDADYLIDLAEGCMAPVNAPAYARTITNRWQRAESDRLAASFQKALLIRHDEDGTPLDALVAQLQDDLAQITADDSSKGLKPIGIFVDQASFEINEAFKHGKMTGIPTELGKLDEMLGGLQGSDLIILAGRPSMGKTALATNIAVNAAKHKKVLFYSLEMSGSQLANRILGADLGRSLSRHNVYKFNMDDMLPYAQTEGRVRKIRIDIDETPGMSTAMIAASVKRACQKQAVGLIVIDYLQLLSSTGKRDGRVNEVSEMTRSLKVLAKTVNVPILLLSQLSRGPESRENKRPMLSDLRDSGSIEQDADIVLMAYRDEYYLTRSEPSRHGKGNHEKHLEWQGQCLDAKGKAELIVAKNRHGETGTVYLKFDGATTTFTSVE